MVENQTDTVNAVLGLVGFEAIPDGANGRLLVDDGYILPPGHNQNPRRKHWLFFAPKEEEEEPTALTLGPDLVTLAKRITISEFERLVEDAAASSSDYETEND